MPQNGSQRFIDRARDAGITVEARAFPEGTRTAQQAADAIGCDVEQIVKSLVFMADERPIMVLTSGANHVDEQRLAVTLGASEVRKADAAEVRDATGFAIGGTPPFGHDQPLPVLCDRRLSELDTVWAAAGTPSTVFELSSDRLVEVTGARVVDL